MNELTSNQVDELSKAYNLFLVEHRKDGSEALIHPLAYQDADGDRLLHVAALRGDTTTIEWLLDAGDDVNAIGDMGMTPAHYAAGGQHKDAFELLLDRGADPTIVDEFGQTPTERWSSQEAPNT